LAHAEWFGRVRRRSHDGDHREAEEGSDGSRVALEVACQSAVAADPGKGALDEARIEHLTINDRARAECLGKMPDGSWCNRVSLIAVQGLLKPGSLPISDLKRT
jgi:hypothetical protein